MAEDRRGFLVIVAAVIGGIVVKAGDELVKVLDEFWFLLPGADDIAESGMTDQNNSDKNANPETESVEDLPKMEEYSTEEGSGAENSDDNQIDLEDSGVFDDVSVLSVDQSISLDPDEYHYWEFSAESTVVFSGSFTVSSGPPVELYVMDQWEFMNYETGSSYEYQASASLSKSNNIEVSLPSGEYVAVVENPCTFCDLEGSGPETSQVDVEMTAE